MQVTDAKDYRTQKEKTGTALPDVTGMVNEVRERGDEAVRRYTQKFDEDASRFREIPQKEIRASYAEADEKLLIALRDAAARIRDFAQRQKESVQPFETCDGGMRMGQRLIPLRRAGCYVPGGRYPLPSTALMTVIPARVAGVDEVIVASPMIDAVTIVAADIAGADRIFSMGGVQAIAAMAYGTESVPAVEKIVGPGNSYVTAAKKAVFGDVGIDLLAGPSEVLIIADDSCDARLVASDVLAQAEHDPLSRANVITFSQECASRITQEVERQFESLSTRDVAEKSLRESYVIIAESARDAVRLADSIAPEHLELQVSDMGWYEQRLRNYGAMFIGRNAAEVFGDFCAGPNHTLPTAGAARYTGGLSPLDFLKRVTYLEMDKRSAGELSGPAGRMARAEGLDAHRRAAVMRQEE